MEVRINTFVPAMLCLMLVLSTPAASAQTGTPAGKDLVQSNCSPCHGESGKGDGPASPGLPVKPADLGERITANHYSDQYLIDVISKGGGSVGKSTFMPAWSGTLNDKQIRDIVAYLRSLPNADGGKK